MAYEWLPPQESSSSTAIGITVSGVPTPALIIEDGPHRLSSTAALALEVLSPPSTDAAASPFGNLGIPLAPVLPLVDQPFDLGLIAPEGE